MLHMAHREKVMNTTNNHVLRTFVCAHCNANIAGCNLVCTALQHTFARLFNLYVPAGERPFIQHLTIQLDNACSDNKNHLVLGYLGSLVARSIIGDVSVQFMPVGHTHIKIDQAFSR